MHKRTILLIASLLALSQPSRSQQANEYVLTELATQQQLPVANVHCILQDHEGYIWYGTRGGGLCRDNGYHIDVFRSDRYRPNLIGASNDITSIAEDYRHHIIFSTKEGLYMLDKNDYTIHIIDKQLEGISTGPLLVASDSTVWVCSQKKIYHYDKDFHLMTSYLSRWKGQDAWASRIMEDSQGRIWVTQWKGGIVRFNHTTNQFEEQYWDDNIIPTNLVEDTESHSFWIGTWGKGIMRYEPERHLLLPFPDTYKDSNTALTIQLVKDINQQRLWASTMYGLCAYDIREGNLQAVNLTGILPEGMSVIDHTAFDNRGNLWVSGFSPHTFILSHPDRTIYKNALSSVSRQLNNRPFIRNTVREGEDIWLGQDREPIAYYQQKSGSVFFDKNVSNISRPSVMDFCKCRDRAGIWGKEENLLYHLWFDGQAIQSAAEVKARGGINCILDAGNGEILIGHQDGIDIYHTATKAITPLSISAKRIMALLKAKNGYLYFTADENHLVCYDTKRGERIISEKNEITDLAEDDKGRIWASTRHGDLLCYDPATNKCQTDTKGSNSNGDNIKHIAIDTKGHIWLLSDQMVKEYNPESGAYRIFRSSDKTIQMDCFHHVKAEDDYVCIDGAGGILYIQPSSYIDLQSSGAMPLITSITIDGENRIVGMNSKEIDIRPDAVNIEIQFSTLNYLHADKVTYAYRLSSIDSQWHYLPQGVNKATFVLLPKGDYTLELMATDEYGCWGQSTKALLLHRLPAWYESWWAYILYISTTVLLIGSLVYYYLRRQKEKQQHQMDIQLTEMKIRFFTNISHELRTPLTLILTPLESMMKKLDGWGQDEQENSHLSFISNQLIIIERNAQRLLSLVNNLLDFRKLEMGQQKLDLTNGDIYDFIRTVCETFRPVSTEKGIGLGYAIPNEQLYVNFDYKKLQHILYNLLSNAFKFTSNGGQIAVSVAETAPHQLSITVKDSGCGIPSRDLPHIFDRYYQSKNNIDPAVTGTGIGLHLTKEYVQLHGGTISASSKLGEGSTFTILLPTDLKTHEKTLTAEPESQTESQEPESQKANLLIVDDNDEFRQFLCGELSEQYSIYQAANGEDALAIMAEHDIDVMVSDVMMPVMDGMTLCRRIKQDISTSHVMVILLTARTAEESQMEGFRAGADDYLSKPFNMEMLQLRISHLLDLRRLRNQDFLKGEEVKVEEVALNEIDQNFLRSAVEAVEKHLNNEDYDIDALATDVFMSRSTLYRKIHSLTGEKPSIFIRAIRLKHAARLIKEGKYSLAEISDLCGFSSPSYFSRCFKAQYGIQPGNYK